MTFEITHDREFLKHFLTRSRIVSISDEMVALLRDSDDPYAAYGYGSWLRNANPDGKSLKEAEIKLTWAATNGVQDAYVDLAMMCYEGTVEMDTARPDLHAQFVQNAYKMGSEKAQYHTLFNTIYGQFGYTKDPDMVADIMKKHLEAHPDSDPVYWDLYGRALASSAPEEAERAFLTAIERGESISYYRLALLYQEKDAERYRQLMQEGRAHDCIYCFEEKGYTVQDDFLELSEAEQQALHDEIDHDLHYAIDHYDGSACWLLGISLYYGELGFEQDTAEAIRILQRGQQLGDSDSLVFMASIAGNDDVQEVLPITNEQRAKLYLQAVRMDNITAGNLEEVARAYVQNLLPKHNEEIEHLWLKKYREVSTADEGEDDAQATGLVLAYPQGFFFCKDVGPEPFESLGDLATHIGADGVDVVHYSDLLTRLSKALSLDKEGCHVAMMADRDGYAKDLPDNMGGSIVYGHGYEIRGTVMFAIEDDKYQLRPFCGLQLTYMFLQLMNAATGGLLRMPTDDELKSIETDGGAEAVPFEPDHSVACVINVYNSHVDRGATVTRVPLEHYEVAADEIKVGERLPKFKCGDPIVTFYDGQQLKLERSGKTICIRMGEEVEVDSSSYEVGMGIRSCNSYCVKLVGTDVDYKGGWQQGSTVQQKLEGPVGNGEVWYPNGDHFKGFFHLSYASINGPAYAADGRYDFADGSYIDHAWIHTSECRKARCWGLHGVYRIHHPDRPDSIAMFLHGGKRYGFELFLPEGSWEEPWVKEWYDGDRVIRYSGPDELFRYEVADYGIDETSRVDCTTLRLTLRDGDKVYRIEQQGGRYTANQYDNYVYEPSTHVTLELPNGDVLKHCGDDVRDFKPYDGYVDVYCAKTGRRRREHWEKGELVDNQEWK